MKAHNARLITDLIEKKNTDYIIPPILSLYRGINKQPRCRSPSFNQDKNIVP